MSISFAVENVLESTDVTVTVSNASTSGPATRLYDRVRAIQYAASSSGTLVNIDATGTVHHPVGFVVLVNHNATTTAILFGSSDYALFTSVAVFNPNGVDPYYSTFKALSTEYLAWRVRFPATITRLKIGEFLLGCAQVVAQNPAPGRVTEGSRANRVDVESVAGYVWSAKLGAPRVTYDLGWNAMTCDDWTSLSSAFEKSDDGAKPFLLVDHNSAKRWCRFAPTDLDGLRITTTIREVRTEVIESL